MIFYKEKFRAKRLELRYTAKEFGRLCEVTRITVARWENGTSIPAKSNVRQIAEILKIPVSAISDLPDNTNNTFLESIKEFNELASVTKKNIREEEDYIISSIKRQRRQIEKANLVINSLLNTMHSAFYIKSRTGEYVFANNEFLNLTEKSEALDIDGKNDCYFFPNNEAEENARLDQKVLKLEKKIVNQQMHIPGTRKKKWGLITKVPITNDEGIVEGMLCTIKDITEEKKANELNKELQSAISNIQDVVWTGTQIDYKLKYTTVNEATEKLLGLTQKQFFKGEWKRHVHSDFLKDVEQYLNDAKSNPKQVEYKYIHPITSETHWLQNRINVDGPHQFGIIRDITEQKIKEQEHKIILQVLNKFDGAIKIKNSRDEAPYLYLNEGVEDIYEVPKSNFKNDLNYWRNFIFKNYKNTVFQLNKKYRKPNADYYDATYELQLLNGKIKPIREHFFKVKIDDEFYQCSIMNEVPKTGNSNPKKRILKIPGDK